MPEAESTATLEASELEKQVEEFTNTDEPVGEEPKPVEVQETDEVKGLKAELARVREAKRGDEAKVLELAERVAKMEGRQEATKDSDPIKAATEDQLISAGVVLENALAQANADGETGKVQDIQAKIVKVRTELHQRTKDAAKGASSDESKRQTLQSQLKEYTDKAIELVPELNDPNSDIVKAARGVAERYGELFRDLGPLKEIFAYSLAAAENPDLVAGKVRKKVVKNIQEVADAAIEKGGTPTAIKKRGKGLGNTLMDMETNISKLRSGEMTFADLEG